MFTKKLKLNDELYDRLGEAAKLVGASSPDELAEMILQHETTRIIRDHHRSENRDVTPPDHEETKRIADKMKGLGYID